MALAERFAPLLAGRYTGQPAVLWQQIESSWRGSYLPDGDIDILITETARETVVEGKGWDVERWCLMDDIVSAIEQRDAVAMMVACDQAEEVGVSPELCDLTRRALCVQYPR